MENNIGIYLCCLIVLVPLVCGVAIGSWLQRRKDRYGWPGAILPGFIREALEDQKWK